MKEVNDLFGRTKHGFFENKVRFLSKGSRIFEGLPLFYPINLILQTLICHKADLKTLFSEGEKSIEFFNLAQKTAIKATNQPRKNQRLFSQNSGLV